jgi:hypothetical protein
MIIFYIRLASGAPAAFRLTGRAAGEVPDLPAKDDLA